jgi:hypothetical protein
MEGNVNRKIVSPPLHPSPNLSNVNNPKRRKMNFELVDVLQRSKMRVA